MLPKSVEILGTTYTIIEAEMPEEDFAETKPKHLQIYIDKTMPPEAQMDALYHELAHAALAQTGITKLLKDELEEAIVQTIGTAFRTAKFKN